MANINYTKPNKLEDFSVWCSKKYPLWCKSNFPFIEDTFEALDTYGLICKIVQYLNETKQNLNTTEDNVQNIYDFVTNYFDNLDVQNEINNKLDSMVSSGELQNLLSEQYNQLRNEVNSQISNQNNQINIIDNKVNSVSSGSPAGVYATVLDLETADPDHSKIYLVEADGKWYYYNTSDSEWTVGGTYQSTGLTIENSVINNIIESQEFVDEIIQAPLVKNSAYNINNGSINSSPTADRTDYIPVTSSILDVFFDEDITYCICFDSNKNYLRRTQPLKQAGHHSKIYLGDDVKFIGINFLTSNDSFKTLKFLKDYVFDYDYEILDYYWNVGIDSDIAYSRKYTFDNALENIPICGYPRNNIGREASKSSISLTGFDTFNYFSSATPVDDKYSITVPFLIKSTYKILDTFFGYKPKSYSACIYGTSISNINDEGIYPNPLEGLITATDLSINARSGGQYTENLKTVILADTNTYDVVFLEGCINDWYYNKSIEDLRNSMKDIFQNLFTRTNKIIMIMDFTGRNYNNIDDTAIAKNNNDIYLQDYLEEFRKICSSYGVDVITNEGCYINEFYPDLYVDQIHQSLKGGLKFAIHLWKNIIKNQLIDFSNVNNEKDFEDFIS